MAFFSDHEKHLARTKSRSSLMRDYHKSERALTKAAKRGASDMELQRLMDKHHTAEYATLAHDRQKAIVKKYKR